MSGSYEAIAWLQPDSDFDPNVAVTRLTKWLPGAKASLRDMNIDLSVGGWPVRLHLNERGYVAEEAQEFPELFPDCPRSQEIARCKRRVEVKCPEEDPGMDHFNDLVFVCQALEEFRGVILFDPRSGELI